MAGTEHIFSDRIVVVDIATLIQWNYGNFGLVKDVSAGIVPMAAFSPTDNRAGFADGNLLVFLWKTCEADVGGFGDLFGKSKGGELERKSKKIGNFTLAMRHHCLLCAYRIWDV